MVLGGAPVGTPTKSTVSLFRLGEPKFSRGEVGAFTYQRSPLCQFRSWFGMSDDDRRRWDGRYADQDGADLGPRPPSTFVDYLDHFPTSGTALDIACGQGQTCVWLAERGFEVWGVDVSPVAIDRARSLSEKHGVSGRCHPAVVDLEFDAGTEPRGNGTGAGDAPLPLGPFDLVVCHLYRAPELYGQIVERLKPGGVLAIAVLSEVGHGTSDKKHNRSVRYRAGQGELIKAFGHLEVVAQGEGNAMAWLLATKPAETPTASTTEIATTRTSPTTSATVSATTSATKAGKTETAQEVIATARAMNTRGINNGMAGNVSMRFGDRILITPSGVDYHELGVDDIVEMDTDGQWRVTNDRHPSSEWRFHLDILNARGEVNSVVHAHPLNATALAVHRRGIDSFHYMVAVAGGSDIRCADYATFGTAELSANLLAALEGRSAALMANHGLVAIGVSATQALDLAVEVETLAAQYLASLALGEPVKLNDAQMKEVLTKMASGQGYLSS